MPADPYITLASLTADLPESTLNDACDDDKDGVADEAIVAALIAGGCADVDEYLGGRFTVPLTVEMFTDEALPALITSAAKLFTLRRVFQRRGITGDQFPFRDPLNERIKALSAIRDGRAGLPGLVEESKGTTPAAAVTEDCSVDGSMA